MTRELLTTGILAEVLKGSLTEMGVKFIERADNALDLAIEGGFAEEPSLERWFEDDDDMRHVLVGTLYAVDHVADPRVARRFQDDMAHQLIARAVKAGILLAVRRDRELRDMDAERLPA